MTTQTMNNFETLDLETLANVEGGRCSWGGFAKLWRSFNWSW